MFRLVITSLLIASAFTQREGVSLAQQRVQSSNGQASFSQVFDLPDRPVVLQDQPVFVQDAFDNQGNLLVSQRPLTFREQQERRRLEQEALRQEERFRQQQLALERAEARRRAQEQNTLRLQNQQPNIIGNRPLQPPILTQGGIEPLAQTVDDQRDGPFQDGTYYFRFATSNGIQREEGSRLTSPFTHEVTGSYSYIAPDGTLVAMEYIADENGYRAYPVRNNVVNPVNPPEPIPVAPPLRPILSTPAPDIIGPIQTFNRPTGVISPRPPLITQPLPDFSIPVQTVRPPIQPIRPVIQNVPVPVQTVRPPIQQTFQTVRPITARPFTQTLRPITARPFSQTVRPFIQSVQRPIQTFQNITPRPFLRPQVTSRPQFVSNFANRPSFATFGTDNQGRRLVFDYDYSDLDFAASEPVLDLEPPKKSDSESSD
ncbi:protein transport protein SEC24-like [Palaemon carinicauda]|uniref:protein transport protein SEC24-like n=1 Tax=Palaemon carinicauda TaxID=392227 RepID=UPI0035B5C759